MIVADILKNKGAEIFSVDGNDSILHALEIMKEKHIGAVLVMAGAGKIAGVLSERDIVRALPDQGGDLLKKSVSDLMTKDVITCAPSHSIQQVMEVMTKGRFRHLPVVEGKKLVGMISIGDAVKERIAETEHEAEALRAYITTG